MAMAAPPESIDIETVPGVDVVSGPTTVDLEAALLTDRVLTVVGAVHRRFLDRRGALLRSRLADAPVDAAPATWLAASDQQLELLRGPDFCVADGASWLGRLAGYRMLAGTTSQPGTPVARIRGWDRTEACVLVDGRSVSGCVLDATVALEHQARRFEDGEQPFALCLPDLRTAAEARTWKAMLDLVQDRLGIPRGAVPLIVSIETASAVEHAAGILSVFRDACVGVCVAEGNGIDEVAVKALAAEHGVRWIGAIPSSIEAG